MSVIIDKEAGKFYGKEKRECSSCGHLIIHYPFILWQGERNLILCRNCGPGIMKGLMADLIHMEAIVKMQRLGYDYTLRRDNKTHAEIHVLPIDEIIRWRMKDDA